MSEENNTPDEELLFHKLNQETGKISWSELQRQFAKGIVIVVSDSLDLIKIAEDFAQDQNKSIQILLDSHELHRATDDDALKWNDNNQTFWAVVVAPWVLVQETE